MGTKILYLEDDKDLNQAVKMILEKEGFELDSAHCGKECLDMACSDYDVFLLDIMLPDISGWDVYKKLKEKDIKAKFIIVTALPVTQARMLELKKIGISDYITKPFRVRDLVHRIEHTLE